MKKWLLAVAALVTVALLGCCGGTAPTKDAKSVFETWLGTAKAIESMCADYDSVIEGCSKGSTQCTEVDIQGTLYVKGNQRLDESEITISGSRQQIKQYSLKDKVYVATMVGGEWVTREVALSIYFNSDEDQAEMESLYEKGALVVGNTLETESISGEECNCVTLSAQLSKLAKVDKEFLLFSGGLSTVSNVDTYVDAIKSYSARFCLLPNGMVLQSEINLEFNADFLPPDGVISSHVLSTMTNYEINPVIPDSLFDLPQIEI